MCHEHESERHDERTELPAELAAVERQLAGLSPAPLRLDRDRLMFDAGRASAGQEDRAVYLAGPSWSGSHAGARSWSASRFWPAATAAMTAATILLAAMLVLRSPQAGGDQQAADAAADAPTQMASASENTDAEGDEADQALLAQAAPTAGRRSWWPWPEPPMTGYLAARHVALTQGVAALERDLLSTSGHAPADEPPRPPATSRELLRELLPELGLPSGARS